MATWADLDRELALWQQAGQVATLWWRDDDAIEPTPALDQLLRLSSTYDVPCTLAVVPFLAAPTLADVVNAVPTVYPVQHGYRHVNHAPPGDKKSEFGSHRALTDIRHDLRDGWEKLRDFSRLCPVFVPPWNRMSDDFNADLAALGLKGISRFAPRRSATAAGGLRQVNTHVDIIDWQNTRGFSGLSKALADVTGHLRQRRQRGVDSTEPTGILTHHLNHDPAAWTFMDDLLSWSVRKSTVRWLTPFEAFTIEVPENTWNCNSNG